MKQEIAMFEKALETLICCYLNAVLEAVEFPAGISDLDTGLTDVDWNALSHFLGKIKRTSKTLEMKWKWNRREFDLSEGRLLRRLLPLLELWSVSVGSSLMGELFYIERTKRERTNFEMYGYEWTRVSWPWFGLTARIVLHDFESYVTFIWPTFPAWDRLAAFPHY